MLQCYKSIKLQDIYWLNNACVWYRRAASCQFEKPAAFEFFPGIVCGGDGPLGSIAVAAERNRATKTSPEGRPPLREQ
jgi:hypothetical protein